jgi:hypothetical protein
MRNCSITKVPAIIDANAKRSRKARRDARPFRRAVVSEVFRNPEAGICDVLGSDAEKHDIDKGLGV